MKVTKAEYLRLVQQKSPRSPIGRDILNAFWTGGLICVLGQALLAAFRAAGLDTEDAGCAVSITLVGLGALLTGLNLYSKIAHFAGAGTIVPITGFANSIVAPAMEFKTEGFITGMAVKMFTIAGPVIVYGISASVIYGLILYLFGLA